MYLKCQYLRKRRGPDPAWRAPRLWPARLSPPRVKQYKHRLIITDGPSLVSFLVTIFSFCACRRLECSLMCNANAINRISSYCLIFFLEWIGVALATLAIPWLRPWLKNPSHLLPSAGTDLRSQI